VLIYSLDEEYLTTGIRYNREKRDENQLNISSQRPKPKHNYIDLIINEHEKMLSAQAQGIDYVKLISDERWPFASFVQKFAELMGFKGGMSVFSTNELEMLNKIYNRHPDLVEYQLIKAFESAEIKNIAHIALTLQKIKKGY